MSTKELLSSQLKCDNQILLTAHIPKILKGKCDFKCQSSITEKLQVCRYHSRKNVMRKFY